MDDIFKIPPRLVRQDNGIEIYSFLDRVINRNFIGKHNKPIAFTQKESKKLRRYEKLNNLFKKYSGISDPWETHIKFRTYEAFLRLDSLKPGDKVLDIGCGLGHKITRLAEKYPALSFIGTDVDSYKLENFARALKEKNIGNVEIVHSSILNNVFRQAVFSAIISTQVFEHFSGTEYPALFETLGLISKPGANICIEVPGDLFFNWEYKPYRKYLKKKRNLEQYPFLDDFQRDGIMPAFRMFEHYAHGFRYDFFNPFLPKSMYFANYKYTICRKTADIFLYKTLNKAYWGPVLFIKEHLYGRREDKKYSKESGFNLILNFRIAGEIPEHVYK